MDSIIARICIRTIEADRNMNITIKTEKENKYITNSLCGDCLHARDAHEKHNGHFMYCACCQKLCDLDQYLKVHMPSKTVIFTNGREKYKVQLGDNNHA